PKPQQNIPPPLPSSYKYQLDKFHTNNFMDNNQSLTGIIDYVQWDIDTKDDKPDNPIEIDLAILNPARKNAG
ncbi:8844_t:CDS:2, partial [Gigaspora rosea]